MAIYGATDATVANMKRAKAAGISGVMVWSEVTAEQYSADPGDYWLMPDDEVMVDSEGHPMFLVVRAVEYLDPFGIEAGRS